MKSTLIWALAALNVLLLATFIGQLFRPNEAMAQAAGRPSEYIMVPAEVAGGSGGVVFIVDTSTNQLSAMSLDQNQNDISAMAPIDLTRIFAGNR